MKPYVESGASASRALRVVTPNANEQRLLSSLRGFEQVIRVVGVSAILLVPLLGVMSRSTETAAYIAINFLAVIVVLDLLERNVKRALIECRNAQRAAGSSR